MTKKTTFLVRVGQFDHLDQLRKGKLRFTPLTEYRKRSGNAPSDDFEGVSAVLSKDRIQDVRINFRNYFSGEATGFKSHSLLSNPKFYLDSEFTHVLCMKIHNIELYTDKDSCIDLSDFGRSFQADSMLVVHDISGFCSHLEGYANRNCLDIECRNVTYVADDHTGLFGAFTKREKFKHEKEYRFAIKNPSKEHVLFDVGDLSDFCFVSKGLRCQLSWAYQCVQ